MSVTINFDCDEILKNIEHASQAAIAKLSEQVLADSNKYCPKVDNSLITSSENNSDFDNGIIVWDTDYAQFLYYGLLMVGKDSGKVCANKGEGKIIKTPETYLNFSKDKNTEAQMLWFEKAKDVNLEKWVKTFEQALKNERT